MLSLAFMMPQDSIS